MLHRLSRCFLAAALSLAFLAPARAGQEVTLTNERGVAIGTPANPIAVTGGAGGGGGGTVTQGPAGASPWLVSWTGMSVAVSNASLAVTQSGAWTVGLTGALPAGTNSIGAVSQGAAGAAPWLVSWSGQSVAVSALPALPAGSNAIGSVTVSNFPATQPVSGAFFQATQPVSAAALPLPAGAATAASQTAIQSAPGTSAATAEGVQGVTGGVPISATDTLLASGTAKLQNATWWQETNASAVVASGAFGGSLRLSGSAAGGSSPFGYFQATILSTQAGTLTINNYTSGSAAAAASSAVTAGVPLTLKVPALGSSFNVTYTNGATAGTLTIYDGYTAN